MRKAFKPMAQISTYGSKSAGKIPHERVKIGDEEFDSVAEGDRYMELLVMQKAGLIQNLKCHPQFALIPSQKVPGHQSFRAHRYTADFEYDRDGKHVVEDVKSVRTREERDYIINRKLMWMLNGIYVEEVLR